MTDIYTLITISVCLVFSIVAIIYLVSLFKSGPVGEDISLFRDLIKKKIFYWKAKGGFKGHLTNKWQISTRVIEEYNNIFKRLIFLNRASTYTGDIVIETGESFVSGEKEIGYFEGLFTKYGRSIKKQIKKQDRLRNVLVEMEGKKIDLVDIKKWRSLWCADAEAFFANLSNVDVVTVALYIAEEHESLSRLDAFVSFVKEERRLIMGDNSMAFTHFVRMAHFVTALCFNKAT